MVMGCLLLLCYLVGAMQAPTPDLKVLDHKSSKFTIMPEPEFLYKSEASKNDKAQDFAGTLTQLPDGLMLQYDSASGDYKVWQMSATYALSILAKGTLSLKGFEIINGGKNKVIAYNPITGAFLISSCNFKALIADRKKKLICKAVTSGTTKKGLTMTYLNNDLVMLSDLQGNYDIAHVNVADPFDFKATRKVAAGSLVKTTGEKGKTGKLYYMAPPSYKGAKRAEVVFQISDSSFTFWSYHLNHTDRRAEPLTMASYGKTPLGDAKWVALPDDTLMSYYKTGAYVVWDCDAAQPFGKLQDLAGQNKPKPGDDHWPCLKIVAGSFFSDPTLAGTWKKSYAKTGFLMKEPQSADTVGKPVFKPPGVTVPIAKKQPKGAAQALQKKGADKAVKAPAIANLARPASSMEGPKLITTGWGPDDGVGRQAVMKEPVGMAEPMAEAGVQSLVQAFAGTGASRQADSDLPPPVASGFGKTFTSSELELTKQKLEESRKELESTEQQVEALKQHAAEVEARNRELVQKSQQQMAKLSQEVQEVKKEEVQEVKQEEAKEQTMEQQLKVVEEQRKAEQHKYQDEMKLLRKEALAKIEDSRTAVETLFASADKVQQ